ncbi:hypothetical protein ESCO13_00050 [Escherichia phage ESCO13]|uniref:Uncharacterized protein n=1 Tax=Escherichia phage ESCO13 TaxID=1881104 RepID=A0A1D7XF76_9CAUD|nr:hypothetical protein HOR21_gp034 [Escherichia phage ESCO13]AOQ27176.1 hypothetical protein ESCO13_00050 [Escherichia phage ESCO13]
MSFHAFFNLLLLLIFLGFLILLASVASDMQKEQIDLKEQCIVFKQEKDANKFLDNNCFNFVKWNPDKD